MRLQLTSRDESGIISHMSSNANSSTQAPWSWLSLAIVSILTGLGGGFFIVWQNLKRMGKEEEAKKFFVWGAVISVVVLALAIYLPMFPQGLSGVISLLFPIWHYATHLKKWQQEHPKQAKFSWSLVGWGVVGLVATLVLGVVLGFLIPVNG